MKRETNIKKKMKRQIRTSHKNEASGQFRTFTRQAPKTGLHKFFLIQDKGKGPPGRSRCPGAVCRLRPDNKPVEFKNNKTLFIAGIQMFI